MDFKTQIKKILPILTKVKKDASWPIIFGGTVLFLLATYLLISQLFRQDERLVTTPQSHTFQGGRVVVGGTSVYHRQNRNLEQQIKSLKTEQQAILDSIDKLTRSVDEQTLKQQQPPIQAGSNSSPADTARSIVPQTTQVPEAPPSADRQAISNAGSGQTSQGVVKGPSIISFPTESKQREVDRIHLSPGAYVETVLLSGVQAANGKPYPVLLKASQAFVGPNKTRIDLSGCFILGKAMGNLSLSRVEIQPYKLACTAKSGRMFERELTGFVADKSDNSFGVVGEVDLKADSRLATLTFLSSMIEGMSRNIERLQTKSTQSKNGVSTSVEGDESRYIVSGGAAGAADKMTEFFLRHAESLLPTINIHSSQKLYVVIQDSVDLPSWYFTPTNKRGNNDFAYLARLLD